VFAAVSVGCFKRTNSSNFYHNEKSKSALTGRSFRPTSSFRKDRIVSTWPVRVFCPMRRSFSLSHLLFI
jgi:hypothetical protein